MMSASNSWGNRLYRGEVSYDFIGKQKRWYTISGVLLLISVASLLIFGLKFSLDFRGGSQFDVRSETAKVETVKDHVGAISKDPTVQTSTVLGKRHLIVKTTPLSLDEQSKAGMDLRYALEGTYGEWHVHLTRALALAERLRSGRETDDAVAELDAVQRWLADRAADMPSNFRHLIGLV